MGEVSDAVGQGRGVVEGGGCRSRDKGTGQRRRGEGGREGGEADDVR